MRAREYATAKRGAKGILKQPTYTALAVTSPWLCAASFAASLSPIVSLTTILAFGTVITVTVLAMFACLTLRNRLPLITAAFGIPASLFIGLSVWPEPSPVYAALRQLVLLSLGVLAIELTLSLRRSRVIDGWALVARTTQLVVVVLATVVMFASSLANDLPVLVTGFCGALFLALAIGAGYEWVRYARHAVYISLAWTILALGLLTGLFADAYTVSGGAFALLASNPVLNASLAIASVLLALSVMRSTMRSQSAWARERAASKVTDRMLTLERSQREFSTEVDEFLGAVSANDFEEVVLNSFLTHLDRVIKSEASAVFISHRGQLRLVSRFPNGNNRNFASVLKTREDLLQSVCLSDEAAVIHSDDEELQVEGKSLTTLCVVPVQPHRDDWAGVVLARTAGLEFQLEELVLVKQFSEHVKTEFINANKFNRIRRQAETDMLTGLMNRGAIFSRAERSFKKARSLKNPLSFLFIDIDNFKAVNDTYGHEVGDRALHRVAQICKNSLRDDDKVGRYGGEEFIAILPGTDEENAHFVAERIRKSVSESPLKVDGTLVRLTVSVGISELNNRFESTQEMLTAADRALYAAKRDGRNRVVHHLRIVGGKNDKKQ